MKLRPISLRRVTEDEYVVTFRCEEPNGEVSHTFRVRNEGGRHVQMSDEFADLVGACDWAFTKLFEAIARFAAAAEPVELHGGSTTGGG
jgi:hypothetical protein